MADTGGDFTAALVKKVITQVVKSEVLPVFRTAGYTFAVDYPDTDISTDATENAEIDWMVGHLVAYRLAMRLPRYSNNPPPAVREWKKIVLGEKIEGAEDYIGWLDKVKTGDIKYQHITRDTGRTAVKSILVSDTTTLFPDSDNAAGDESNEDDWIE